MPQMVGRGVGSLSWAKRGAYVVRGMLLAHRHSVPGWPFLWLPGLLGRPLNLVFGTVLALCLVCNLLVALVFRTGDQKEQTLWVVGVEMTCGCERYSPYDLWAKTSFPSAQSADC